MKEWTLVLALVLVRCWGCILYECEWRKKHGSNRAALNSSGKCMACRWQIPHTAVCVWFRSLL